MIFVYLEVFNIRWIGSWVFVFLLFILILFRCVYFFNNFLYFGLLSFINFGLLILDIVMFMLKFFVSDEMVMLYILILVVMEFSIILICFVWVLVGCLCKVFINWVEVYEFLVLVLSRVFVFILLMLIKIMGYIILGLFDKWVVNSFFDFGVLL